MRFLIFSVLLCFSSLFALQNNTVIDMTAGYRQDHLDFEYKAVNLATGHAKKGFFKADDLQIFEIGLKLKYALEKHWYLRGFADFGWIVDGQSHMRTLSALSEPPHSQQDNNGHVMDMGGALGYMVFAAKKFNFAPVLGWAFDRIKTDLSAPYRSRQSVRHFKTTCNGPFIGLDLFLQPSVHFVMNVAYALQIADQRIKMDVPHAPLLRGHSEWGTLGQLFFLGLWYRCYSGWRFGLEGECLFYRTFKSLKVQPASQEPFYAMAKGNNSHRQTVKGLFSLSYDY
ncbi:MAG TPA: hypothetical protein VJ112_04935 [Rhabdochlamydiaceae bacterium]|nr:hypothetical protein [Rhabdochlamydiaceae bacterium]